jgi:glycosyltransferase involved in cell wall biosynthesis
MRIRERRILLISPQPWQGLHMSKHHLARALSERGNQVVFLDPPTPGTRGVGVRWEGDVQVATYTHWLRGANHLPKPLHMAYYRALLRKVARATGGGFDLIWCFDTSRMQWFPKGMGVPILHLADIDILHQGQGLMREARLVLTVSEAIRRKVRQCQPLARVFNAGHALDKSWFVHERPAESIGDTPRTVAYAGQMQWNIVDWDSLFHEAHEHPGMRFHFYGPYRADHPDPAFMRLRTLPNVHFHGTVTKAELMPALHAADILLLCYRSDLPPEQVSNSHKLLEYLATGNVVVASFIPELADQGELFHMASPGEAHKMVFERAVHGFAGAMNADQRCARRAFAAAHTMEALIDRVEKWLADA